MNKFIDEQFKKVLVADVSRYDPGCSSVFIPKKEVRNKDSFKVNHKYIVELDDKLLQKRGDIIETNWNKGIIPVCKYYLIEVYKVIGDKIQCAGIAYDPETNTSYKSFWNGYFPINCIKIIREEKSDK